MDTFKIKYLIFYNNIKYLIQLYFYMYLISICLCLLAIKRINKNNKI